MPPAATVTGANETTRQTVNSWITGGSSGADVVVDLAADSRLSNTGDTTYFASDGVHFTTAGYGVWASLIKTGLASLGVT
jgi:lysophospholipase L1-like esterase